MRTLGIVLYIAGGIKVFVTVLSKSAKKKNLIDNRETCKDASDECEKEFS